MQYAHIPTLCASKENSRLIDSMIITVQLKTRTLILLFLSVFLISCRSVFPPSGTIIDCNGQRITPLTNTEKKPEFPGGKIAFNDYLWSHINVSDEIVNEKVAVFFVVTKSGEICDIRIVSKENQKLDNEVKRVLENMPNWNPGTNSGLPEDAYYYMELRF